LYFNSSLFSAHFYLTDAYGPEEVELSDPHPVQALHRKEGKRPAVLLRARFEPNLSDPRRFSNTFHPRRDRDEGEVRIYPGRLQDVQLQWCAVKINNDTTVAELTKMAMDAFGLGDSNVEDFRMSEVLLDRGGMEESRVKIIRIGAHVC